MRSPEAPKRIRALMPHAKLIVCLRNPVNRAYSHYRKRNQKEKTVYTTFDEAVRNEYNRLVLPGFYHAHLSRYLAVFPREQIHVILYDDILERPRDVVRDVYRFLGVDASFEPEATEKKINAAGAETVRIPYINRTLTRLDAFMHRRVHSPLLRKLYPGRLLYTLRTRYNTKRLPPQSPAARGVSSPSVEARRYLLSCYEDDIKHLEELIGRDLSAWKQ